MSKILIDEAVVRQALKKLEELRETVDCEWGSGRDLTEIDADGEQWDEVIALRQALANAALDKMAENARELGLSYEQPAQQESVEFLANGTRFKISCDSRQSGGKIHGIPPELNGRWVALVAAEDDCHLKLTHPAPAHCEAGPEYCPQCKAEQPAQEPVIQDWMKPDALCDRSCLYACTEGFTKFPTCVSPTAPTQEPDPDELTIAYMSGVYEGKKRKPWVGLTDEDKEFIAKRAAVYDWHDYEVIEASEAKLKEKNTKGGAE